MLTHLAAWFVPVLLSAPLAAVALGLGDSGMRRLRHVGTAAAIVIVLLGARQVVRQIAWSLGHPVEWDFSLFWLFGRAVWLGRNPFAPASFTDIELPLVPNAEFRAEVLEVGALYPPPTMLLFAPLGALDYHTAQACWYALHLLAGAGCALLLGQLFFGGPLACRVLFGAAILLALPLTATTLAFGQTNLLVLLFALLAVRDARHTRSGVWIALGTAVKPWIAILGFVPLLHRHWRATGAMIATGLALLAASAMLLGIEHFTSFFTDSPEGRAPAYLFIQPANQSLFATASRFAAAHGPLAGTLLKGLALGAAALALAVSLWLVAKHLRRDATAAYALLLPAGLLLYPSALWHYSVTLVLPLCWLWSARGRSSRRPLAAACALALLVVVLGERDFEHVWIANVATWLAVAATVRGPDAESA